MHEAFLRLPSESKVQWRSRSQFSAQASTLMYHILVDRARTQQADKRSGGVTIGLDELDERSAGLSHPCWQHSETALDILALDQSLRRLEQLDAMQGRVVELRWSGEVSIVETTEALQISPATVKREWVGARAWLLRELSGGATAQRRNGRPVLRRWAPSLD